ncbi:MAG: bifunctional glutamate N-acetyltransferase/amino-acid acetyltransferase ArgJ [Clostridia bacterium]|nr:bifunctional glutamate N-acetyltransferase/amino-acid acetyltransferase ArgJ [Clostridia bacterium]
MMKTISGGVTAAQGFSAAGVHCGIRKNRTKKDLALILSDVQAATACVYTKNLVKGAPILVTKAHVADGYARAVLCNSGNANTCNADGVEVAEKMCAMLAAESELGLTVSDCVIASTGVIGQPLPLEPIAAGVPELVKNLKSDAEGSNDAAEAIMTTDTVKKEIAIEFIVGGKTCRIGGIAKGSGMIHPNMATMLVFVTSDVAIDPALLQKALSADILDSFNMVSVDGDTSTNDMVSVLCNGMAGNAVITDADSDDYKTFCEALAAVTTHLCRSIAADGEGATKLLQCEVTGAADKVTARIVAKSVICSSLVKAAMFGADANWGRILCAIGYSGADVDITKIDVSFASAAGTIPVCKDGAGIEFSEELAKQILLEKEIRMLVSLNAGNADAVAWGCDLTYDYVKINGDYRT